MDIRNNLSHIWQKNEPKISLKNIFFIYFIIYYKAKKSTCIFSFAKGPRIRILKHQSICQHTWLLIVIHAILRMLQLYKIVQLCIFITSLEFTSSEILSNPKKDPHKWCEVPNVQTTGQQGSSELNVEIKQFPFMASYGYLKGTFNHIINFSLPQVSCAHLNLSHFKNHNSL